MSGVWAPGTALQAGAGEGMTVTLIDGSSFCLSWASGDIQPGRTHGLFISDTRVLSQWRLQVDGEVAEPLTTLGSEPYAITFVGRIPPRGAKQFDSTLLVQRERRLGNGMREHVVVRNLGREDAGVIVTITVDADFADLFEVKESHVRPRPAPDVQVSNDRLSFTLSTGTDTRSTYISATGDPLITPGLLTFRAVVPAHGEWSTLIRVRTAVDDREPSPTPTPPAQRLQAWRLATPVLTTADANLARTLRTSAADLGALQIHDPAHPDRRVVAAGAPWFMALFGRDSLLTSWMALPLDQQLALGTLYTLADYQGRRTDALTEEQPGRILHEMRLGREVKLALGGGHIYYGTADATPLFVAVLGELHRWGVPAAELQPLLPAADRALAWIEDFGDLDGDGFVEYRRATDRGLLNQGWKDSFDGVNDMAGRLATPPIALAEVQGYVYAAYLARASIASDLGDEATAINYRRRAAELKRLFNEQFWLPDLGWYAVALDGEKRQVDALASNMGHCLWSGIVDERRAAQVAQHLVSPQMWTGFGIRTLARTMGAYNPMSYHNGSVWPHDSAIAAAGLMRYGFVEEAQLVALGLLDAAERFGGRLPELFCGFDRSDFPVPVPYPTSCSPQAWAAAAPVLLIRTLLRLEPDVPDKELGLDPALPARLLPFSIEQLPVGPARLRVEVRPDGWEVAGLPAEMSLRADPVDGPGV